jgi:hypothetical protein
VIFGNDRRVNPSGFLDVFVLLSIFFTSHPCTSIFGFPEPPYEQGRQHQRRRDCEKEPHVTVGVEAHYAAEGFDMDESHAEKCLETEEGH